MNGNNTLHTLTQYKTSISNARTENKTRKYFASVHDKYYMNVLM